MREIPSSHKLMCLGDRNTYIQSILGEVLCRVTKALHPSFQACGDFVWSAGGGAEISQTESR